MMKIRIILLLLVSLFLFACAVEEPDAPAIQEARAAQSGMRTGIVLVGLSTDTKAPLPGAIAGLLTGRFLIDTAAAAAPMIPGMPEEIPGSTNAETELLKILVTLLDTDVSKLLNRSSDREAALDEYTKSVIAHVQRGTLHLRSMQDALETHQDAKDRADRRIRDIRNEMEDAIASGAASQVAFLTDELIRRQQGLGEAEAGIIVNENLVSAFEDVLDPLRERLDAMEANRDALISGVTVIDMPGVEDLQLIEFRNGVLNIRRSSGRLF